MGKLTFIITAGPTREHIDPVRFISNPSTGKMGFAIACAAAKKGHEVKLIAGPVLLKTPAGVIRRDVISAQDMKKAVDEEVAQADKSTAVLIATAAVADWKPQTFSPVKTKKCGRKTTTLNLVANPDIVKSVKGIKKIGFAAETGDAVPEAIRKCKSKNLEMIVGNDVTSPGSGFGTSTNKAVFVTKSGKVLHLPLMSKNKLAEKIVRFTEELFSDLPES
jgi:phosphopantothenoylcysteine decarboxylase/phosphopantothenate--cysteine ligase